MSEQNSLKSFIENGTISFSIYFGLEEKDKIIADKILSLFNNETYKKSQHICQAVLEQLIEKSIVTTLS